MFSTDYSEVNDGGGLLPEGEYETIIKYAGEDTTKSGTVGISVTMVIRNDVEQQYKNKHIWHMLWHRKEPTPADLGVGGYSFKQIQSLSKAAGLPNGKKYESLAAWCEDLANKCVRVTVEHEEYKGKTRAKVKWVNASKHPDCQHEWKGEGQGDTSNTSYPAAGPVDVSADDFQEMTDSDDDLPF